MESSLSMTEPVLRVCGDHGRFLSYDDWTDKENVFEPTDIVLINVNTWWYEHWGLFRGDATSINVHIEM